MNLSRKTLLLLTAVSILSVVLSFFVLKSTVFATFIELENDWASKNTATVEAAFQAQLSNLLAISSEYSQWDDTYSFLQEGSDDYISKNITEHVLDNLDLDAIVLLNKQGSVAVAVKRGPDNTAVSSLNLPFKELDAVIKTLLVDDIDMQPHAGILETSQGPLFLATRYVTPSDGFGPSAGSVIFSRTLNKSRISGMADQLNIAFDAIPINSTRLTPELLGALEVGELEPNDHSFIEEATGLLSYKRIKGILGQPAFVLEVTTPRGMSTAGSGAVTLALLFLALTTLLYLLVSNFSLKRLIVRPVSELTQRVGHLQESGDLSVRLHSKRNDELGTLTRQVDAFVVELDTAQRKMTEARDTALDASRAKSEFLATMSHEIRTPINGVLGMTELLLASQGLSDQQRRYAETVQHSGGTLLRIINDILDISKIEVGKLELDIEPFNLTHLVEGCLELLAERAHGKGLELHCDIPFGTATHVLGDPARLRQILINLIGNAVKFTEGGEIIVRVLKLDSTAGRPGYRIEVDDTGVGIDSKYFEKIFEPFSQQDSSTTRQFGGTGLGLSICRQLVTLMGGEIGVNSTQGTGSIFWFTVPLTEDKDSPKNQQSQIFTGRNVLIVNDNETSRKIFRNQLEDWRMQVQEACSAAEALDLLHGTSDHSGNFDLILLDMRMSKKDGLQLAQAIRKEPGYGFIPMIMLGPLSDAGTGEKWRESGLDTFLNKPVSQDHLHDTLATVIGSGAIQPCSGDNRQIPTDITRKCESNSLRILVAEDNKVNLAVAQGMLHVLGHITSVAGNGHEAVAAFQSQEFDVVMMDCLMPLMDGFEATCSIRKWEEIQNRTPTRIVAVTANAQQGDREQCIAAGMNDYLSKPYTIEQLAQALEHQTTTRTLQTGVNEKQESETTCESQILEQRALVAMSKLAEDSCDSNIVMSLTNTYVEQAAQMAEDLPKMLDTGDLTALQSTAHKLKSNSSYFGAQRVSRSAAQLEHAVREGKGLPRLRVLADQLSKNLREALPVMLDLADTVRAKYLAPAER